MNLMAGWKPGGAQGCEIEEYPDGTSILAAVLKTSPKSGDNPYWYCIVQIRGGWPLHGPMWWRPSWEHVVCYQRINPAPVGRLTTAKIWHCSGEMQSVEALTTQADGLVITPGIVEDGRCYILTHAASGLAVGSFLSREAAERCAAALASVTDWTALLISGASNRATSDMVRHIRKDHGSAW